jgi:hypothetical protein
MVFREWVSLGFEQTERGLGVPARTQGGLDTRPRGFGGPARR